MKAQNALRLVQTGETSENAAIPLVQEAVKANTNVAEELKNIQKAAGAQPPPLPPRPPSLGPNTAGKFLNSLGNNPSANNLNKVRSIANQANQNVVTSQARQVRSKARAILNPFLLSENDINRLSRNLNSNNSTLKTKAMNKLQNIANTYNNNTAIRRMASSKLLEFRKRPINIKIQNPMNNTMMNVKWNNSAKQWVLVGNSNKARFNLTNNRNKTKTPEATVKQAPIN
jgi:hypothetical protein